MNLGINNISFGSFKNLNSVNARVQKEVDPLWKINAAIQIRAIHAKSNGYNLDIDKYGRIVDLNGKSLPVDQQRGKLLNNIFALDYFFNPPDQQINNDDESGFYVQ